MSGQTVAWLLAGLFVVPLAVVAADTVQRGYENEAFENAPVHQGERFVYDVTVLSDFAKLATTAERVLEIEVLKPFEPAGDGFVPIKTTRSPASWDIAARESWESSKATRDMRYGETVIEYVTLAHGALVYEERSLDEDHWYASATDVYHYASDVESAGYPQVSSGSALDIATLMGNTWVHQTGPFGSESDAPNGPMALPLRGEWDGRLVYGRSDSVREVYHEGGTPFDCSLPTPNVPYSEPRTAKNMRHMELAVETTVTTWFDPTIALPVVTECHSTISEIHPSTDIGHIRVAATLSKHEAGGKAYDDVPWDTKVPEPTPGTLPSKKAAWPGVPSDRAADSAGTRGPSTTGFRFPLSEAYAITMDWEDENWRAHFEEGAMLVGAGYAPGMAEHPDCVPSAVPNAACASDMEDEFAVPSTLPVDEAPKTMVSPSWWLSFDNDEGVRMVVHVMRQMTVDGQTVEDHVSMMAQIPFVGYDALYGAPENFVPVEEALQHWLNTAGPTLDQWRNENAAAFYYTLQPTPDGGMRPAYTFRSGTYAEETSALAKQQDVLATLGGGGKYAVYLDEQVDVQRYDATHGAKLESGTRAFRIEGAGEPVVYRQAAGYVAPVPTEYVPVAAVVVGIVSIGTVGVGASPGGRSWLRGLAALPLFTKLSRNQVLEHRTRDSMMVYVKANPGVGTEEIRKHLGIGWGTAVYHLSALEQSGLLSSIRQGGNRHWFSAASGPRVDKEAIALLRSPAARRLHEAIQRSPGRTQQELAGELGVTHGAVIFQVRKLEQVGLIRKERDGRFVRYFGRGLDEREQPNVSTPAF